MTSTMFRASFQASLCRCLRAAVVLAAAAGGARCFAVDPPGVRPGGLLPAGDAPPVGLTREELTRSWDLDGDGSISKTEADVARGRMRQQRLEMQLGTGIDPITGEPRGIDGSEGEPPAAEDEKPRLRLPEEPSPPAGRRVDGPPGSRAPQIAVPRTIAAPRSGATSGPAAQPSREVSGRASWLPPRSQGTPRVGGRAAAAPGSGAWSGLRPGGPAPRGPRDAAGGGSGGLLPTARPPVRTGSIIIPGLGGPPGAAAAGPSGPTGPGAPAAPPVVPRPRITAEEIGGYRP